MHDEILGTSFNSHISELQQQVLIFENEKKKQNRGKAKLLFI